MQLHGVYAISDTTLMPTTDHLLHACDAALQGGVRLLQYRDKSTNPSLRLEQAQALATLCRDYGAELIINDDVELALTVGAGVHLGQTDGDVCSARARLGKQAIIGVTCHDSLSLAQQAVRDGASYVAFGAFYASATKPGAKPAPLTLLVQARECLPVPVVAIGGLNRDNIPDILAAGADMVAVVRGLFAADDIRHEAAHLSALFACEPTEGKCNHVQI